MRKPLLHFALFSLAIPAAFAQTSSGSASAGTATPAGPTGAATPMATPSQTPAEITAPGKMREDRAGATAALTGSEAARNPTATHHPAIQHPMKRMHHGTVMGGKSAGQTSGAAMSGEIRPGHEPGVGESFPASDKASNITASDTRTTIAPRLPTPAGGADASPATFLADAQKALNARQSGRAQEALERAETAMLHRSVAPDQANTPDQGSGVTQVRMARDALAKGDMAGAKRAISAAMAAG